MANRNSLLTKLHAIWRRDLLTVTRSSAGFGMVVFSVSVELATFYYLARSVGPGFRPQGFDYFWYLLIGTAFFDLLITSVRALVQNIREAQISGIMEVLMTTSTPSAQVIVLQTLSSLIGNVIRATAYVTIGILISQADLPAPNVLGSLAVLALAILLAVAIGLVAAGMQLWLQKGDSAVALIGIVTGLFSGVLFPISVLPPMLRILAEANPFSHALFAFRMTLLQGASLRALQEPLIVLLIWSVALFPFGLWLFSFAMRRARATGSLAYY